MHGTNNKTKAHVLQSIYYLHQKIKILETVVKSVLNGGSTAGGLKRTYCKEKHRNFSSCS
jgi:hypothetical protein